MDTTLYFREGFQAYHGGVFLAECPYAFFSDEGLAWADGWEEAESRANLADDDFYDYTDFSDDDGDFDSYFRDPDEGDR